MDSIDFGPKREEPDKITKPDKITVKVEIHDDTRFVVRYSPYPEKEILEELAEKVYVMIRDSKERLKPSTDLSFDTKNISTLVN